MSKSLFAVYEGTKAAVEAIKVNALRSALTCLGIIIGVAAVITVVAVMQGFTKLINEQFSNMAPDVITVKSYTSVNQEMLGNTSTLSYEDFLMLKKRIIKAETITAIMMPWGFSGDIEYRGTNHASRVMGTESNYPDVYRIFPEKGRFLFSEDDLKRRRVAFIGPSIISALKLPDNPVGEYIQLGGEWFRIVGVAEPQGSFLGFDQDDYINIPISTMQGMQNENVISTVEVIYRLKEGADERNVQDKITRLLRQSHKLKLGEPDDFEFETAKKSRENISKFTNSATAITAGIVGVSLLVGGIGVMNIMLVSVTERTRVIGTLKALGAPPNFIMLQFLVEAIVLSLFGGVIGLAIGYGIAELISMIVPNMPEASVPGWSVGLSFGFTTMIGLIFGIVPALKAARLNPIDALKYE
jgi:putative ABC transport system permease protein